MGRASRLALVVAILWTLLAEAGASSKQIMSVGGWKNLQDVQIYIEKAEQKRLAQSAISLLEGEQK